MSKAATPSFVFGYWRPWNENANAIESYLDYTKDVSLAKYGADTVGQYIQQASQAQIDAINSLGNVIGQGLEDVSEQLSEINVTLSFINRNLDLVIEQQNLSNLLLHNVAELLRVPDSEKERQHCIELGVKFFVNAQKDADLYADALEELLKAEALMKQDYFVLHRIGCIYLYAPKFINPELAFEYFLRAAKYASVESDKDAVKLANILTKNLKPSAKQSSNPEDQIGLLAADSYEKSAFTAYILGRFEEAVNYQAKAVKLNGSPHYRFILAKYQSRNGDIKECVKNLSECIEKEPKLANATFKELDLINEPQVIKLIDKKNEAINIKINQLLEIWKKVNSAEAEKLCQDLKRLLEKPYHVKFAEFSNYKDKGSKIEKSNKQLLTQIDALIDEINKTTFLTLDKKKLSDFQNELTRAKDFTPEKMEEYYETIRNKIDKDKLKIGSKYAGGIVFYLDKTGKHGLVCAEKDLGEAVWRANRLLEEFRTEIAEKIGVNENGIGFGAGQSNTKKIVDVASSNFFLNKVNTAARLCYESNINGYSDWYLPTADELLILLKSSFAKNRFKKHYYWSSTEKYDGSVLSVSTGNGSYFNVKIVDYLYNGIAGVIPVRAF
jgi:hypothetical protein